VKKPKPDFFAILEALAAHKVDFIVVGGVAAVLQGAPIATFDLDVVHANVPDLIMVRDAFVGAEYEWDGKIFYTYERELE